MSTQNQWLTSTRVLLPDHQISQASILIHGAQIERVIQGPPPRTDPTPINDLGDALLTPAFVNAHTHLAMCCFRGLSVEDSTADNVVEDLFFAIESNLTHEDITAFARIGAYESLLCGVGVVWEHYYGGIAIAEAIAETGLCAVVAPTLQDIDGPGAGALDQQLDATLALHGDSWASRGIWSALGPHATDTVSDALFEQVRALSRQHDLPVHAHVAQSIEEYQRSIATHAVSPFERLDKLGMLGADGPDSFLLIHAIFGSSADIGLLDPTRHTLGFCPYSQLIFGFPADVATWQAHDIPWFVATDAAASNDSMNVQKELRYVAGLRAHASSNSSEYKNFIEHSGLDHAESSASRRRQLFEDRARFADESFLLDRVWGIPGALHPSFTAGVIAQGALANLIVWDTDAPSMWPGLRPARSIAMADTTGAIQNVMLRGSWVGETGDYHRSITQSDAYRDARTEASARLRALLDRIGL